ncbi:MAG: pitrilysin family protein [Thermoanaerobaculia bacterium]
METRTLDDGLSVWLDPMRDVRSVALGVYVAGGSADEEPEALGSTHFLEHLLFRRSRRRTGAAIARTTDRLGGDCDAYTTKEWMAVHARTPSERLVDALALLLDLTEAPAFTAEDVETERKVILEEMAEASDVPEDRLHETFVRAYWPDHPLGAPILGTDETVRSLTRGRLVRRFREVFRPEKTLLAVVGAFEPETFLRALSAERKKRRRLVTAAPVPPAGAGSPRGTRCAFHIPRPDLNQTHLLVGSPAPAYADRQVPAAWLLSVVLGGGVSSRLWRRVRERHGLAYQVGAGLTLHRDGGMTLIEAATAPEKLPKLVRATGAVLRELRRSGITRAELRRAKDQMRAEIAMSLESTSARREGAVRSWFFRGRPWGADEVLAEIEAVTPAEVDDAIGALFGAPEASGFGVTGPTLVGATVDDLAGELAA